MGKIGAYDYPDIQFGTLLKAVEILQGKFKGKVNDEKTFAQALGHKTNNSGGFLMKLADLRRYGLIEKKGIEITQRAKDIFVFVKPETKKKALNDAIMEIRLWKDLYGRLNTISPTSDDFKLQLVELTSDTDKVVSLHETIRKLYIDALNNFTEILGNNQKNLNVNEEFPKEEINQTIAVQQKKIITEEKVPDTLIVLKSGEVEITLPKTQSNITILKNILDGLLKE